MTTTDLRGPRTATGEPEPNGPLGSLRRRRRAVTIVAAAVVVLALFAVWLVAFSSVFGVRTVRVLGLHSLTSAEVEGRAGIADGTPLVRVDTAAITSRVESLPEVYSAEVATSFPSTVIITVVERTAVGYVRSGGVYRLVDRTGDAYSSVAATPSGLPQLVVSTTAASRPTRRAVAAVAAALDALPRAQRPHVESIQALSPDAITLVLTKDRIVQWGTPARSADKARVLPILLRKGTQTRFDVSDPDQPYSN